MALATFNMQRGCTYRYLKRHHYRGALVVLATFLLAFSWYMGVFTHLMELDYNTEFTYPLDQDLEPLISAMQNGMKPQVRPINDHDYKLLKVAVKRLECQSHPLVTLMVKSSVDNFARRSVVRETWGSTARTVFLIGDHGNDKAVLDHEGELYGDLVQGDFFDAYTNLTIKTMMGLRWASEISQCQSKFYLLVDDDYYVSVSNLQRSLNDITQDDPALLYSGLLHPYAGPHRHRTSKWFVSLSEYPYHAWPPYVIGGAAVLSRAALLKLYYASYFVKRFRFEDVYLGLVARKVGVEATDFPGFYLHPNDFKNEGFRDVIATHGFQDHEELRSVWSEQWTAGIA